MIPEELEDNEDVEKLTQEYTEGEIKFSEFQERLDFISRYGYDMENQPGEAIKEEITEEIHRYEKENLSTDSAYILVNYEQYKKIIENEKYIRKERGSDENIKLFGYDVKFDKGAVDTPKVVENSTYEYNTESETPLLDGTKVF